MRVLITGSSGRIGSAIARRVSQHHEVVGLDIRPGPCTSIPADICDDALVRRVLARVDAVIHTASLHAPDIGLRSLAEFRRVNVDGTRLLLEGCLERGIARFVYTSTTSLYGHSLIPDGAAVWVTEELEPRPRDIYDETKIEAEDLCRNASREGLACVSLRMSRCFPEPDEVVAGYRLHRGVDERDVAEAHLLALTTPAKELVILNVSAQPPFEKGDCEMLLRDAASVIRARVPWAEEAFRRRGWLLPRSIDRVYVVENAARVMGWTPRFGLQAFLDGE